MKPKKHIFQLTVECHGSRRRAYTAVLVAFAKRGADGCNFILKKTKPETNKQP